MTYQFKKIEPGAVQVGDLYLLANSHGGISAARVTHVNEEGFGYEKETGGGNVSYDSDMGIIIRQTEGGLEICLNQGTLEDIQRMLGLPQVEPEIDLGH